MCLFCLELAYNEMICIEINILHECSRVIEFIKRVEEKR